MSLLYTLTIKQKDLDKKIRKAHAPIEQVVVPKVEYNRAKAERQWRRECLLDY